MSLLDQEVKRQEPKGKKLVLAMLILSVILLILALVAMFAIGETKPKTLSLSINGTNVKLDDTILTTDENGVYYISLQKIASQIGYVYNTGVYKEYSEDATNTKCYLEKEKQIVQIEAETNIIEKTSPESVIDYEEYELQHKILKVNNLIYIALDDLPLALNVIYNYSQNDNKIILETVENLTVTYKTKFETDENKQFTAISEEYDNEKAISHNMLVVSIENGKWGVVNSDFETVIGNKFSSMKFIEQAGTFIVSDDNKFGVISSQPNKDTIVSLDYEEINVICNNPLCYEVKRGGKSAIVNEEGQPVIADTYDSIGYISNNSLEESTIVIKDLGKNKITALVVCKEDKYGLVNITEGKAIGTCVLDKIYSKNENNEDKYYVVLQDKEISLDTYIESVNTTTVDIGR